MELVFHMQKKTKDFPFQRLMNTAQTLGELQDILGRAFHDKDETCAGDSTDESEDESNTSKDIDSEAFTTAHNLHYLTKHLPESVSSAVNTNHYHLMATNALFCFGTMLSKNKPVHPLSLKNCFIATGLQRYKLPLMVIVYLQVSYFNLSKCIQLAIVTWQNIYRCLDLT